MIIRIKFYDVESDKTKETQEMLFSSPNGTFLTSSKSFMLTSNEIINKVGYSVIFWHLDVNVLNEFYGGVLSCLNSLLTYPGVKCVDILPIEGDYYLCSTEKYEELKTIVKDYL